MLAQNLYPLPDPIVCCSWANYKFDYDGHCTCCSGWMNITRNILLRGSCTCSNTPFQNRLVLVGRLSSYTSSPIFVLQLGFYEERNPHWMRKLQCDQLLKKILQLVVIHLTGIYYLLGIAVQVKFADRVARNDVRSYYQWFTLINWTRVQNGRAIKWNSVCLSYRSKVINVIDAHPNVLPASASSLTL